MAEESTKISVWAALSVKPRTKEGAAKLPIYAVALMLAMKIAAAVVTGSIAIRADAIHSALDLAAAIIAFVAIKIAAKPPDEGHKYGHTKAEDLAGIAICLLILLAAGTIFYEAVMRLVEGGEIASVDLGIWVTVAAIGINLAVSWWVLRMAKVHDSVALKAEGKHLFADVLSSVAVLVGLVLVRFTGIIQLDSVVALLIAGIIAKEAIGPLRTALDGIMDRGLPKEDESAIAELVSRSSDEIVGLRRLRTRKSGSQRFAEVDVVIPRNLSMGTGHRIGHRLNRDLERTLAPATVSVRTIPCSATYQECSRCGVSCDIRKESPAADDNDRGEKMRERSPHYRQQETRR